MFPLCPVIRKVPVSTATGSFSIKSVSEDDTPDAGGGCQELSIYINDVLVWVGHRPSTAKVLRAVQ